jgi:esterase/lipase
MTFDYKYSIILIIIGLIIIYIGLNLFKNSILYHPIPYNELKYDLFLAKLIRLTQTIDNVINRYVTTPDGINLDTWYVKNPYVKNTILFIHGNAGNVAIRYEMIAFLYSFASIVIFDYRSFGNSTGTKYKLNSKSLLIDCETIWDYCINDLQISNDNLVVMGESLGCSLALELTAFYHKPKALILNSPFYSLDQLILDYTGNLGISYIGRILICLTKEEYRSDQYILELDHTIPIIIAHSKIDEIIPYRHALQLYQLIDDRPNVKFLNIGGTHSNLILTDEYIYNITQFLQ